MNREVEKIRKEIERRKKEYCNGLDAVTELYDSLLSFIDSLQEEKNRFNIGDIVRNEITEDTYTIVEILEDKYRAVLNGYSKSPIYVIPLNQGGWELVSPSSTIGLRTKEENSFDSHIQEGDKITVNENGSRFNRSQLERVIAAQEYANQMEKKFMCGTEFYTEDITNAFLAGMKEADTQSKEEPASEGLDLDKEIETHLKECLDIKFPTTDIKMIAKDVEYTARKFFELGLKARKGE